MGFSGTFQTRPVLEELALCFVGSQGKEKLSLEVQGGRPKRTAVGTGSVFPEVLTDQGPGVKGNAKAFSYSLQEPLRPIS